MRSKTVVQLILFLTSFVIIFTYIKPSYTNLQTIQSETEVYIDALESAKNFNTELRNQLSQANTLTTTQLQKLDRYLPAEIDTIAVMRDIEIIAKRNSLEIGGLSAGEEASVESSGSSNTDYLEDDGYYDEEMGGSEVSSNTSKASVEFTVSVSGSYEDFKMFLHDLERNAYPLEVTSLTLGSGSSSGGTESTTVTSTPDNYTFNLKLETYKLVTESE